MFHLAIIFVQPKLPDYTLDRGKVWCLWLCCRISETTHLGFSHIMVSRFSVRKTKNILWAEGLQAEAPCWWGRSEEKTPESITLYSHSQQKSISECTGHRTLKVDELQQLKTTSGSTPPQLRTGVMGTETGQLKTGKEWYVFKSAGFVIHKVGYSLQILKSISLPLYSTVNRTTFSFLHSITAEGSETPARHYDPHTCKLDTQASGAKAEHVADSSPGLFLSLTHISTLSVHSIYSTTINIRCGAKWDQHTNTCYEQLQISTMTPKITPFNQSDTHTHRVLKAISFFSV